VVGFPLFPVYVAKAGGFFFVVFGVLALMGGLLSINPVWNYGPYDPSPVSAGSQPDWYMLFLDGALRLMPGGTEIVILGFTLSLNILIPAMVVPGVLLGLLAAWPFIEAAATGDKREHHVLDRPRNAPVRTGVGVALLTALIILAAAGALDLIATHFHLDVFHVVRAFQVGFLVLPFVAFAVTKRIALALQRRDRELVLHGHETGRVVQLENGGFKEVHRPLTPHERWTLVSYKSYRPLEIEPAEDAQGIPRPGYKRDRRKQRLSRFFFEDRVEPVTPAELEAAHAEHAAIAPAERASIASH
jgi:ubiquinol-cytochrome c reductase cytochrome b subunit